METITPRRGNQSQKRRWTFFLFVCFGFFIFGLFFPNTSAIAQALPTDFGVSALDEDLTLSGMDITVVVLRIVRAVLALLGIIALIIVLYAGFVIMTSGGDEEKIATGKQILVNGVIGLTIILSSVTIVHFVINGLKDATGLGGDGSGTGAGGAPFATFSGSGSLGSVIESHYPLRDQVDVPRNTKIAVTFAESIDSKSFIDDANGNKIFGDCISAEGKAIDWEKDCDRLKTDVVQIFPTDDADALVAAAAMTTAGGDGFFRSFVFRPLSLIGNENDPVNYTIDLTEEILKADGKTGVFKNSLGGHYLWNFQTSTELDEMPPTVVSTFPNQGSKQPRNSVVQITFSEPVDPSTIQGLLDQIKKQGPSNMLFGNDTASSTLPTGEWKAVNTFKSLEFVSNQPCGVNSCGETIFCLPISCAGVSCTNGYRVLAGTSELFSKSSFEAVPFTGLTDMAGNALDGGNPGVADGKPPIGGAYAIDPSDLAADNFSWNFTIENTIDRSIPWILSVTPDPDAENVDKKAPVEIRFNKQMMLGSLSSIAIEEHGTGAEKLDDVWTIVSGETVEVGDDALGTNAVIQHREFGPNGLDLYYFPSAPHTVRDVYQNCLYPGYGPIGSAECGIKMSTDGDVLAATNCTPVTVDAGGDTGCVVTNGVLDMSQPNIAACLNGLKSEAVSPVEGTSNK